MYLERLVLFLGNPFYQCVQKYPRICVISVCLLIYAVFFLSPLHVTLVRFKSVNYSFAVWIDVKPEKLSPKNGDYLMFKWNNDDHSFVGLGKGDILIKKVGCTSSSLLEKHSDNTFFCDGSYAGQGLEETPFAKQSISIYPFPEQMRIPEGKLFMIGDSFSSYDSKYFGFVDKGQIVGRILFGIN